MTTITQPRTAEPKGAVNGAKLFNRLCAVCLTLFALIWLVPFVWALITSLRDDAAITQSPASIFAGGWSLDDGVGLLFEGTRLQRIVSSRPGAGAQRVDQVAGELVRNRLEPELLGANGDPSAAAPSLDEDVQELRRVQRLRRTISGPRGGRLGGY